MTATVDQLREAGFGESEIQGHFAPKVAQLQDAGFSQQEIDAHLGFRPVNVAEANKNLAAAVHGHVANGPPKSAFDPAIQTVKDIGSVYAPIEAALNVVTGAVGGFPAYLGGGIGQLINRAIGADDADPKVVATRFAEAMTYQPRTEAGQRLTNTIMLPLHALMEGSTKAGEAVADATGSPVAAAITEATIQTLPLPILAAFGRSLAGKLTQPGDFRAAADSLANGKATPEAVTQLGNKIQDVYEKTGIDPTTLHEHAQQDVTVLQDLAATNKPVPGAYAVPAGSPPTPPAPPVAAAPPTPPAPGTPAAAQASVLSRINIGGKSVSEGNTLDSLYTALKDDLYPIAKIEKALTGGADLATAESPYTLARLTRGSAGKAA
ncbi:MAG: hypothetical protein V4641_13100, partial [Pseudomonadota bacterium]